MCVKRRLTDRSILTGVPTVSNRASKSSCM